MILGLSYLDFSILIVFLIVILAVGLHASKSVKHAADFYLGGRKLGKTLQFFLNFGNATDTNAAPTMASSVYSKGASGIWLQLQTLLFTPWFWFTQPWFRRARVTTMADLFVDRFDSKACASAYAIFNVLVALITLGLGNLGGYSVAEAMMLKPESAYTQSEKAEVAGAARLAEINKMPLEQRTTEIEAERSTLLQLKADGKLRSQFSAITKTQFYVAYNLIVAIFIMLGGLKAAAITDAIQGILILFMSLILLPIGLYQVGGFSGLHIKIPDPTMFYISGTRGSNFTWYSILALTFTSFIQIIALQHNMSAAGSATNENTARFGMLSGGFLKRLVLICWMLCGFLGLALLSGKLDSPDYAWGSLSRLLLPIGISGIMLSGMLLGHMPAVGLTAVAVSGLVVRNLYEPVVRNRSQQHYLRVAQVVIVLVLSASIAIAWNATGLQNLTTKMIVFNSFFGAVFLLLFFWRRLTVPAILISFIIWIIIQVIGPMVVGFSPLAANSHLTMQTVSLQRLSDVQATAADVTAGRASAVGQIIKLPYATDPFPLFFDKVEKVGDHTRGSFFRGENLVLYYIFKPLGADMRQWSLPQVDTARYLFDGLFPFVILLFLSLLTPFSGPERAPAFYAKMKTPVAATPELDHEEVHKSQQDPQRFDSQKLFPRTHWEFCKWTRQDYLGFFGCYGIVVAIVGILWLVLHIGKPGPWF